MVVELTLLKLEAILLFQKLLVSDVNALLQFYKELEALENEIIRYTQPTNGDAEELATEREGGPMLERDSSFQPRPEELNFSLNVSLISGAVCLMN